MIVAGNSRGGQKPDSARVSGSFAFWWFVFVCIIFPACFGQEWQKSQETQKEHYSPIYQISPQNPPPRFNADSLSFVRVKSNSVTNDVSGCRRISCKGYAHQTGKRDYSNTNDFVADLAERVPGVVQITSDGWSAYPDTVRAHLLGRLNFAVMQKIYGRNDVTLNKADPNHRYSQPKCTGIKLKTVAGDPDVDKICTSHVERLNLSVRTFNRRFTRLCVGWSRKLANHRYSVALFVTAYNFCKVHSTMGCTPAVGARLTNHNWTIEELVKRLSETI